MVVVHCAYNHTQTLVANTKFRIMIASGKRGGERVERQSLRFLDLQLGRPRGVCHITNK